MMKKAIYVMILTILTAWGLGATPARCNPETPPPLLVEARQKVAAQFERMDAGLKQAAQALGTTGLTGEAARAVLTKLCADFDCAIDCAAVDLKGKMVAIGPAQFQPFEGKDISGQEQVKRVLKTGTPVMSRLFRSVEGFPAIDVEHPVVTPGGQRIGSVSILFHPEKLLGPIIGALVQGTPVDIWAMDKNGWILYDVDKSEVGLNLFESPLYRPYPKLIRLGRRIAAASEGSGAYRFRDDVTQKNVKKKAHWQSVSLYGTEWRLVAVQVEHKGSGSETGILVPAATLERKLEAFAATKPLVDALASGNKTRGMRLLKAFYEEAPGIYSVQWLDAKGINRFGFPVENSLSDYNYNARRNPVDPDFLKILAEHQPAVIEAPLFEGRTGIFTLRPVFKQDRYLGMVYFIQLKP